MQDKMVTLYSMMSAVVSDIKLDKQDTLLMPEVDYEEEITAEHLSADTNDEVYKMMLALETQFDLE